MFETMEATPLQSVSHLYPTMATQVIESTITFNSDVSFSLDKFDLRIWILIKVNKTKQTKQMWEKHIRLLLLKQKKKDMIRANQTVYWN